MPQSSAARTNLDSTGVVISDRLIGEGSFRECFAGTFVGGCRNNQAAACKRFKQRWRSMEMEYFASDFKIADTAIIYAEKWNSFCSRDKIILVTKGNISNCEDDRYLCEPLIRNFKKFTSNSGWIEESGHWTTQVMEAFSHYTYHASGEYRLVCDLQGRYRDNSRFRNSSKSRFELTDIEICSVARKFGPTDLGEKGIESFFANHVCNDFCNHDWVRPYEVRRWFPRNSSATSMFAAHDSHILQSNNRTQFQLGVSGNIVEECNTSDENSEEDPYGESLNDGGPYVDAHYSRGASNNEASHFVGRNGIMFGVQNSPVEHHDSGSHFVGLSLVMTGVVRPPVEDHFSGLMCVDEHYSLDDASSSDSEESDDFYGFVL